EAAVLAAARPCGDSWPTPQRPRASEPLTEPEPMIQSWLALALLLQTQAPPQQLPPSPIARLQVTPAAPVVDAQDTLRLSAQALDAHGQPVPGARVRFVPAGGRFEGDVTEDGLVRSGSTG